MPQRVDESTVNLVRNYDVWDLDSYLPFPCSFEKYASDAIRSENNMKHEYRRFFRVVAAKAYLTSFASNRSHMRKIKPDGSVEWSADPPNYPPICTSECDHNLDTFWSMDPNIGIGSVVDFKGLHLLFDAEQT